MSESEEIQHLNEQIRSLTTTILHQNSTIVEMRAEMRRATEWLTTLTFDDAGVFQPGETPPILSLLASIQEESRTIRIQNDAIIAQNALFIGEPSNEEAAILSDAQARGRISLPALLKQVADGAKALRTMEVKQDILGAGLIILLILMAVHVYLLR